MAESEVPTTHSKPTRGTRRGNVTHSQPASKPGATAPACEPAVVPSAPVTSPVITAEDEAREVPFDAAAAAAMLTGASASSPRPVTPPPIVAPAAVPEVPPEVVEEAAAGIGEGRMHFHRMPSSRRAGRKGHLGNEHSRTLVEIVNRFGVIDMRTAIALCTTIGGGATGRYYRMRVKSLEAAGVLRRIRSRDVDLGPVVGRSVILTPGAEWERAVSTFGANPSASEWRDARHKWLVERVALTHVILDRVLHGWMFAVGDAWVQGLGTLDRSTKIGTRARSIATAVQDGLVRFADPAAVWGLLPPDGTQHPALVLGHNATPYTTLNATLHTARRIAPVEIICYRRSATAVERVRRLVMKRLGGAGDSSVTVLPSASGTKWRRRRHELLEQLESGTIPGASERLRTMIAIGDHATPTTSAAA